MWKCPICNNEEKSKYVCRKCGYDTRKDFVQWRTVCHVSEEDVQERIKLKSGTLNKSISNEGGTKKAEEPRKKSAFGFKMLIPVIGILLVVLVVAFVMMDTDKNRIQSAGVTYKDDLDDLCVLESDVKRSWIRTIAFLDFQQGMPEDAWDVSEKQDGSVMAYIQNNDELYFAADGPIKANIDSSYFFAGYTNLEEIRYNDAFDTSDVTDMTGMFAGCQNLGNPGIEALDTSQVTDMSLMFCNIDNWKSFHWELDTRNVTDMSYMFAECDSLEWVSVSGWDTSNVTDMSAMFANCQSLESLDLSSFDTSNVNDMREMFYGCRSLKDLNISNFTTTDQVDTEEMFTYCVELSPEVYEGIWDGN